MAEGLDVGIGMNFVKESGNCTMESILKTLDCTQEDVFHDVILVCRGAEKILLHQLLLKLRSPYFVRLFNKQVVEGAVCWLDGNGKQVVVLKDMRPDVMRIVKTYMYTDKLEVDSDAHLLMEIIRAAEQFEMPSLRAECQDMLKQLVVSNVDKALQVFDYFIESDPEEICEYAENAVCSQAEEALKSVEFTQLSKKSLCRLLKSDNLVVNELKIFHGALAWAKEECRRREWTESGIACYFALEEALYLIRFPLIEVKDLMEQVIPLDILSNESVQHLLYFNNLKYNYGQVEAANRSFKEKYSFKKRGPPQNEMEIEEVEIEGVWPKQVEKLTLTVVVDQDKMDTQVVKPEDDEETLKKEEELNRAQCPTCGKGFSKNYLPRHMKTHKKNATDVKCMHCSLYFESQAVLKLHWQTHKRKPFNCSLCYKGFISFDGFLKHQKLCRSSLIL